MPILAAEPECFPETLFCERSTSGSGRWLVVQTKPRQEKCLARRLHATETVHYLPTIAKRRNVRGRIVAAQIPLFPGYVFLNADHQQRLIALMSNRIVRCLEVADQEKLWGDLRQIRQLSVSGLPITPEARLGVGTRVEITSGPLAGLHGTVEKIATGHRFYVQVDFIERGASVLIDDYTLSAVGLGAPLKKWSRPNGALSLRSIPQPPVITVKS